MQKLFTIYAHNVKTCILGWHLYTKTSILHIFFLKYRSNKFIFEH